MQRLFHVCILQFLRTSIFKKNKNRNTVENPYCSLGLLQQTMMISIADHHDLSVVCQAHADQIVGQQKSGPLQPVVGADAPIASPSLQAYVKSDDRKKGEVLCKRADKKIKRLIDPRISSLHFKETDIAISISNLPSGCYPTIFDPTKAKNTTNARSKRLDNRKRRCAEQPKAIKGRALRLLRTNSTEEELKTRISHFEQNLSIEDIQKL